MLIKLGRWLALLTIALLPLYYLRFNIGPIPTNLIEILVAILVVITLVTKRRLEFPIWQPIILLLVGVTIGCLIADDQLTALGILKSWFVIPILYYGCLATLFKADERTLFIKPILVSVLLVSSYAVAQYIGLLPLLPHQGTAAEQYVSQGRALGFFESPNLLALFLVPLTLLCGVYFWLTKNFWSLAWLILPVLAVGLSQSLGGVLAMVVGVLWLLVVLTQQARSWPFLALTGMILLGKVFLLTDNASRLLIWRSAGDLITENLLFGIGPGQFQTYFIARGDGSALFTATAPYALHPHNLFLNIWLSAGLAGLVGFIWLVVRIFKQANRSPLTLAALAGLIAIIVHGLVDSAYFRNDLSIVFWSLVFLASNAYGKQNA